MKEFVVKVVLLAGTCDLPAKCLVQNFRQFNGFFGCPKCLQPGSTFTIGPHRRTHVYSYNDRDPAGLIRTKQVTIEDIKYLVETGKNRHGVLGPSCFNCLQHFDIIKDTGVDYMHGCLLGVTRALLTLWLNPEHKIERYNVGALTGLLDRRLTCIQPPCELSRCPRPLVDRKHWKASEYRYFLLYYFLPVLFGVLPPEYFKHYALFVVAMRIFVSESITPSDLSMGMLRCLLQKVWPFLW